MVNINQCNPYKQKLFGFFLNSFKKCQRIQRLKSLRTTVLNCYPIFQNLSFSIPFGSFKLTSQFQKILQSCSRIILSYKLSKSLAVFETFVYSLSLIAFSNSLQNKVPNIMILVYMILVYLSQISKVSLYELHRNNYIIIKVDCV